MTMSPPNSTQNASERAHPLCHGTKAAIIEVEIDSQPHTVRATATPTLGQVPLKSPSSQHDLAEANEAIFSLLGVVGGIVLGGQVSWLQITITYPTQSPAVQASSALGIIGVIFNTIGTAGSLLTARWFRLLGPEERDYLHRRWDAWMRKSVRARSREFGDMYAKDAKEPELPGHSASAVPHPKREGAVALTLLIPIIWVIGGSAAFVASVVTFTFATQPSASAIIAFVVMLISATFLPFYFVGHSTARVCQKLYIKRKQL